MKKIIKTAAAASALTAFLLCPAVTASATTIDDVINHAHEVGMPEEMIQSCISAYGGKEHSSEECDQAIAALDDWKKQRDNAVGSDTGSEIKQEQLENMTNEEKNQLLKELDPEQQMEVISGMLGFGDAFGYNFSIEDMSDGSVMISARDKSNKLKGVTVLGDSIEKTGISYTVPILTAAALILLSAAGMAAAVKIYENEK